jgi:hypothetical protein
MELLEPTDTTGLPLWVRDENLDLTGCRYGNATDTVQHPYTFIHFLHSGRTPVRLC